MTNRNQVVITNIHDKLAAMYMENDKLTDIIIEAETNLNVGDIFVARVKNKISNINACFVELYNKQICYLPLDNNTVIHEEDLMLVQIKKPAVKTKQPVASTKLELVGKYIVIDSFDKRKSVSKKIPADKKVYFDNILSKLDSDFGIVIRTNAINASDEDIEKEYKELSVRLNDIIGFSAYKKPGDALYKNNFYKEFINNYDYTKIDRIITDDKTVYDNLMDSNYDVTFYSDEYPIDKLMSLSSKIEKANDKTVWLKSGANIVIEYTEALTVIDVNTSKAISGKKEKSQTIYNTNIEAATEIARQIRLRNISGIIIVDFIDMNNNDYKNKLLEHLKKCVAKDKVKTNIIGITKLGLVEITRTKRNRPLREALK